MKPQEQLVAGFVEGGESGTQGMLKILGDEILSFGWYPVARREEGGILVRRQMYSVATALHIKTIKRVLESAGWQQIGLVDDANRDRWWRYRLPDSG